MGCTEEEEQQQQPARGVALRAHPSISRSSIDTEVNYPQYPPQGLAMMTIPRRSEGGISSFGSDITEWEYGQVEGNVPSSAASQADTAVGSLPPLDQAAFVHQTGLGAGQAPMDVGMGPLPLYGPPLMMAPSFAGAMPGGMPGGMPPPWGFQGQMDPASLVMAGAGDDAMLRLAMQQAESWRNVVKAMSQAKGSGDAKAGGGASRRASASPGDSGGRGSQRRVGTGAFATPGAIEERSRTTVMLRNLPNDYTRDMLLKMLDDEGFNSKYNFVYLPVDFKRMAGLGYAFVNMETHQAALEIWKHFDGFKKWALVSPKVCQVAWGEPLQGLESHIERYRNSPVMHSDVEEMFKPLVFRNGQRQPFPLPTKRIRQPRMKYRTPMDSRAPPAASVDGLPADGSAGGAVAESKFVD
mmetsp:Transcript_42865/g.133831  ORF Transcript_42865/g.133831 Transcript_42865/m.133831 type:complete len:411 (+) Transcript_42865:396-1628(+)